MSPVHDLAGRIGDEVPVNEMKGSRVDLNGIDARRRTELHATVSDVSRMSNLSGPWEASIHWEGGFRSVAHSRGHSISFDEPLDLSATDTATSPHEHVLSALGACLISGVVLHATLRGVELLELEVTVSGTFDNILRWAGLDDTGNPGYRGLEVRARISAAADEAVVRELWQRALSGSPVAETISRPTSVIASLEVLQASRPT